MWRKEEIVNKIREKQGTLSLRQYAKAVGCSAAYLSKIYNNEREPGPRILDHLGIEKTTNYKPKKKWRKDE